MRVGIAILLILHGFAHFAGVAGAWGLQQGAPAVDHLLGGRLPLNPEGVRLMGVFWLLAGLGVMGSGIAALARWPHWLPLALGTGAASLCLCLLTLPEAWIGAALNAVVMALLTFALRQHWPWVEAP